MEKQIEEMANDIAMMCPNLSEDCCGDVNCVSCLAKGLIKQGYRKISEIEKWTIREISEGIENIIAEFEMREILKKVVESLAEILVEASEFQLDENLFTYYNPELECSTSNKEEAIKGTIKWLQKEYQ